MVSYVDNKSKFWKFKVANINLHSSSAPTEWSFYLSFCFPEYLWIHPNKIHITKQ